jgi:NADP-dependent 3-hydroxy acid dehydrogenase YdfG
MSLQGKSALITGASKGIGRALALHLAKEGMQLGLVARSEAELDEVKAEVEALGASVLCFVGSVADEPLANEVVETMINRYGKVDFLVCNAGFGIFKQADMFTSEDWESVYETNVKGTFLYCKAVLPSMKEAWEGHIINVASDVAKRVFDGGSLYCSSKFAQDAFSMALRKEVRAYGIKVSVVYSGLVDTHFHAHPEGDPAAADWLKGNDMADAIQYVMNTPRHVVIDELMIHPLSQEY